MAPVLILGGVTLGEMALAVYCVSSGDALRAAVIAFVAGLTLVTTLIVLGAR